MIGNINEIENDSVIRSELCVIGGGAAGITIAQELAGSGIDVCVLEGGGLKVAKQTQALYDGESSGAPYFPLMDSRCRVFGGSTFHWGARGAPMSALDFTHRPWVPDSGWPIPLEELRPYYARASDLIGMHSPFDYGEDVWRSFDITPCEIDTEAFKYQAFQFGKIVLFADYYRDKLQTASNVRVYLHANATNIKSNAETNHIENVSIKTLQGKKYTVEARCFVLACGGIENPRLLLLSTDSCANALCNDFDVVGRYFMEHPTVPVGTVVTQNKQRVVEYYSPGRVAGRLVELGMALSPQIQETDRCLNAVARIKPALAPDATQALKEILWDLSRRRIRPDYGSRLTQVFKDPAGIVRNVYRHLRNKPKHYNIDALYVEVRTEQAPNPNSRVALADSTDALGLRKARLHWELTELEKRTMQVTATRFGRELTRIGHGEYSMDSCLQNKDLTFPPEMVGGHHHMGTTRMAEDPKKGVIDKNCRAHGIDNLFIAGSSVFPTASFVNPTLTIVALTLRLTDYLRTLLR